MLKAILFDLDGTLLDTIADIAAALNRTLDTSFTPEECKRFVGNGLMNTLKTALEKVGRADASAPELFAGFVENYRQHPIEHTKPYPGIMELLGRMQRRGIGLGVYSNKEQDLAGEIVARCLPGIRFDMVVGMHGGYEPKPSSQAVVAFCDKVACSMDELLYVGDSEVDYRTSLNAGVRTVILTWGMRPRKSLEESGIPEFMLVDDMDGLRAAIDGFGKD